MNQLARKIVSELVIAVYQAEVTCRPSLKGFLVKLFSKDFKEYIGSHFKQCSPLGRTPIAQKMMADVLAFINCAMSRILINDLRGFYDQFNEGLAYRAYNMRDLTDDDYDLIITSEPGTAKIKSFRIVKQIGKVRGVEATKMTKVQKKAPVIVPSTSVPIQAPVVQIPSPMTSNQNIEISRINAEIHTNFESIRFLQASNLHNCNQLMIDSLLAKNSALIKSTQLQRLAVVQDEDMEIDDDEQILGEQIDSYDGAVQSNSNVTSTSSDSQPIIIQHVLTLQRDEVSFNGGVFVGQKIRILGKINLPTVVNESTIPEDDQEMIFAVDLTPEAMILMEQPKVGDEEILMVQPEDDQEMIFADDLTPEATRSNDFNGATRGWR